jgi:L-alanine-DL-glutamate epimerase-like enolase superfamily enzyme
MAASGAVDCLQADVTRCGGITVWLRAAAVAEGLGLHISGHCAPRLHAQSTRPCPTHVIWSGSTTTSASRPCCSMARCDPQGGTVTPGASGEPGHGLTLNRAAADRYCTT